jgi:hypothetical protein
MDTFTRGTVPRFARVTLQTLLIVVIAQGGVGYVLEPHLETSGWFGSWQYSAPLGAKALLESSWAIGLRWYSPQFGFGKG